MRSSTAQAFCKRKLCPDAASLAAYQQQTLLPEVRRAIARHLEACEFCYHEAYFLQRCLPIAREMASAGTSETLPPVGIPPHLKRLAEDILSREISASDRIVELVSSPRATVARDF